jgi:hypothetical protein
MKKALTLGLAVLLTVLFTSCTSSSGVKSGAAAGEALIKLMPIGTMGVVAIDVERMMRSDATMNPPGPWGQEATSSSG